MPSILAQAVLTALVAYALIGAGMAGWLLAGGLRRLDPIAAAAPLWVKALWVPGMLALWPALLVRAFGLRPPEDRA